MNRNRRSSIMKRAVVSLVFLALMTGAASAQEPTLGTIMTKDLANQPGQEVTLTPGQGFYEGPMDIHVVGRNVSTTKPAKFLVVLIKAKGAPALVPVK
jgi:hypothetical protein